VGTFAAFPNNYSASTYVSLTDERDNKIYPVLKMGNRWMMARNLDYRKNMTFNANAGQAKGSTFTTAGVGSPAIGSYWCPGTGNTSSSLTCDVYGAMYTWETAMVLDGVGTWVTTDDHYNASVASGGTYNHGRAAADGATGSGRGICPEHWHVPTDAEWGLFFDAVEGSGNAHSNVSNNNVSTSSWVGANAGKFSKSACTGTATDTAPLWSDNANRGTDTYGFRGLPTGSRYVDGSSFFHRGDYAFFWTSSAYDGANAWYREFFFEYAKVNHRASSRSYGFSVRCIRD
jgi:uncharacterized protein (TIGR02145 family)